MNQCPALYSVLYGCLLYKVQSCLPFPFSDCQLLPLPVIITLVFLHWSRGHTFCRQYSRRFTSVWYIWLLQIYLVSTFKVLQVRTDISIGTCNFWSLSKQKNWYKIYTAKRVLCLAQIAFIGDHSDVPDTEAGWGHRRSLGMGRRGSLILALISSRETLDKSLLTVGSTTAPSK